jgi:hypothetical protein
MNAQWTLMAVICDTAVKASDLQLIWDESDKTVTGYKVYQFGAGGHKLLGTSTARYYLVKKPSEGYANLCFAVETYVGSQTSKDSSQYCYAPGATATTRSFKPSHTVTQVSWKTPTNIPSCSGGQGLPASTFFKGADNTGPFTAFFPWLLNEKPNQGRRDVTGVYAGNETGILQINYNVRQAWFVNPCPNQPVHVVTATVTINAFAGAAFDLGELTQHKLYSASLMLNASQTVGIASGKTTLSNGGRCPMWVEAANREWWLNPLGNLTYNTSGRVLAKNQPAAPTDVTSLVSAWASVKYANNYGFIVENNPASGVVLAVSSACLTKFSAPSLQVVYF